jgi:energy-coupling factor transport system permease protein
MKDIFEYVEGNTLIHRLNPVIKILLAFCICVAAFASSSLIFLLALLALNLLIGAAGGVFNKALRLLYGLLKVSIFLFILQLLFIREGRVLFLFVTDIGVFTALRLVLRLICACIPLALMLSLTQLNDLTNALVRVAHLPYKYAFTLATAIRFIPLFMSEMAGIMEAQTARGVEFDTGSFFKKMKLILPLCVPLLMISVRKIDGTAVAAEVRGFNLRTRSSGYKSYPLRAADISTVIFCGALIAIGIIL